MHHSRVTLAVLSLSVSLATVGAASAARPAPTAATDLAATDLAATNPVAVGVNFDGSRWEVEAQDVLITPHVAAAARVVAEEAVEVYGDQVRSNDASCSGAENPAPNWGLEVDDPDCVFKVFIMAGDNANGYLDCVEWLCPGFRHHEYRHVTIRMWPEHKEFLQAQGLYLDPVRHETRAVVRSSLHRALYLSHLYGVLDWNGAGIIEGDFSGVVDIPSALVEGQARFVQTLGAPDAEDHPTSRWYGAPTVPGANQYQSGADNYFCNRGAPNAAYWGFLYAHDGGMQTLLDIVQEFRASYRVEYCDVLIAEAVTAVLARSTGEHDSHEEAMADFALAMYTGDGMAWAPPPGGDARDWARYLAPARVLPATSGQQWFIGGSGVEQFVVAGPGSHRISLAGPDEAFVVRAIVEHGDGSRRVIGVPAGGHADVSAGPTDRLIVQVVRISPYGANFTLNV